jgi:hypothetical protein
MTPGLPELLRLATAMAQLHCHSTCKSSPAVGSSRQGGTPRPRKATLGGWWRTTCLLTGGIG